MSFFSVPILWLLYFFLEYKLREKINIFFFLAFLSILISLAAAHYLTSYPVDTGFLILSVLFLHIGFLNLDKLELKFSVLAVFYYLSLLLLFIIFWNKPNVEVLIPVAVLSLLFRRYSSVFEFLVFLTLAILTAATYISSKDVFYIGLSLLPFTSLVSYIEEVLEKKDKEIQEYKDFLDRAISNEVQKKLMEIENKSSIETKKLKELFKISNHAVSATTLEEMANSVVDGLLYLGYSGVFVYFHPKGIYKKWGYFPNYEKFLSYISTEKWKKEKKILINEDERYIFIRLKSGQQDIGFLAIYKKDGVSPQEVKYLQAYANSISIAAANLVHFQALNELERLTYQIFESVDIGIAVLDGNFKLDMSNSAFKNIVGRKNVEGKSIFDVLPEVALLKEELKKVLLNKKPLETEFASLESNRKNSIFRLKILPLHGSNIEEKLILILEDITEKEQLEGQIMETEKLAVIGKMAAGLSHDIKTPLTVISGAAFMIKRRAKENEEIKKLADKIESQSKRAEKIINRLLNYSKPSYWKLEKINLKELLEESIEFAKHSLKDKKLDIQIDVDKDILIEGDRTALQQVFTNLIINAGEAIKDEGFIKIKGYRQGNKAVISIEDSGIGIPKEHLDKIFDPFFTTKEKGTGLGLAVVQRIVKDHNGKISVKSEENKGTIFIVELPIFKG